jgi:hypothetical protein
MHRQWKSHPQGPGQLLLERVYPGQGRIPRGMRGHGWQDVLYRRDTLLAPPDDEQWEQRRRR